MRIVNAFRLTDGALQWLHKFTGAVRSIGFADGVLYVGTLNGTVYAFQLK
jgi:outer membrane protein assembly factor BamB